MDGFKIATAFVTVEPDTDGFDEKLKAKLEGEDPRVKVHLEDGEFNAAVDEDIVKMRELGATTARPNVDASSARQGAGWMGMLVAGLTAVAPVAITAGTGLAAFGLLAIPTIKKVIDYQTLLGQHTATSTKQAQAMWATMDAGQRQLSTGVHNLAVNFDSMAKAVEPQVITDFNIGVHQALGILPELAGDARAGGAALGQFFNQFGGFLQGGVGRQFFTFVEQQAGPDMRAFGNLLDGVTSGVFGLTEALNPLAKILVTDLGGLASFIGDVARSAPWLVQWAVGGTLAAVALSKIADGVTAVKESAIGVWIAETITGMTEAATAAAGAAAAEQVLAAAAGEAGTAQTVFAVDMDGVAVATTAAAAAMTEASAAEVAMAAGLAGLGAIPTAVVLGAAAVAVGGLTYAMMQNEPTIGHYIGQLAEQDKATGYNIAGYQKLAAQLRTTGGSTSQLDQHIRATTTGLRLAKDGAAAYAPALGTVAQSQQLASSRAQNLTGHLGFLEKLFGLTRTQAEQLAAAAGVSASQLAGSGKSAQDAMNKIIGYADAGATATTQTTQLSIEAGILASQLSTDAQKANALATAFKNLVDPQLTLMNDTVTFKQNQTALAQALDKTNGRIGVHGQAQQAATTAVTAATAAAFALSQQIEQNTGDNQKALAPLEALKRQLVDAGLKGAGAAKLLAELNAQIAALKSKTVTITVNQATQQFTHGNQSIPGGTPSGTGASEGTVIPGYAPGRDTEHYMLSKGEGVLVPEAVRGLGEGFVHAANLFYGGSRVARGNKTGGHMAAGGIAAAAQFGFPQDVFNITLTDTLFGTDPKATRGVLARLGNTAAPPALTAKQQREQAAAQRIRQFEQTGAALAKAFSDGSLKTLAQIKQEASTAIAAIQQYYSGRAQQRLVGAIREQTHHLERLANQQAAVTARIAAEKQYASQITTSLASYSALSGLTAAGPGETSSQLGTSLKTQLGSKLATLHKFFAVIGQLKDAGVDKQLIGQVVALGPDQGIQYAQAILSGGATLISELNSEEAGITGLDKAIGRRATEIQYGQSITGGFLDGLKARRAEIGKEMRRLGDEIARELAQDFHVPQRERPHDIRHHHHGHHQGGHAAPMITINFHGERPGGEEMARIKRELAMALGGG